MSNFTNQLGNWNPQLLREYRGRLKTRSLIAAVVLSAIAQILLMLFNLQDDYYGQGLTEAEKWLKLWTSMTWLIPYTLFTVGSYYLVSDLTQEEQRGTLNFIRLSPYPAWKILLGKLLGVPVLPYLTVALAIPLHIVATVRSNLPLSLMLSYYVLLLAGCVFCYSAAMLYGLIGGVQLGVINRQTTTAIAFTAIAFFAFSPLFVLWNIRTIWMWINNEAFGLIGSGLISWFFILITNNVGFAHLFNLASLSIGTALIWSMLLRRFRQPRSTIMTKRQSYLILACLEVFMLGFFAGIKAESSERQAAVPFATFSFMAFFSVALILILILSICPRRQALLDWVRYPSRSSQSWIWADKSPIAIAILIQILIAAALLLPWAFVTGITQRYLLETILVFIAIANVLFIYGVLVQQILAAKIRNPLVWAIGALGAGLILPPTILILLGLGFTPAYDPTPEVARRVATIWTFFGYPFWDYGDRNSLPFVALAILLQWFLLAFLLLRLRRSLQQLRAGQRQVKATPQ